LKIVKYFFNKIKTKYRNKNLGFFNDCLNVKFFSETIDFKIFEMKSKSEKSEILKLFLANNFF